MTALLPRRARGLGALAGALLTPHGLDRYTELLHPLFVRDEVRAEVTAVRRGTADTVTLTLRPSRSWPGFRAGQYVRVAVDIDGVRHTRCFSLAGSQHQGHELELTVKANGFVTEHLRAHAVPGMVLGIAGPFGDFTLPAARPQRVLLVSGGSGITPVLALLRTLADEGSTATVTFLHYATRPAAVPYRAELAALAERLPGLRVVLAYTREPGGDLHGHCTAEHLAAAAPWYRDAAVYVCGPPALHEAVRALAGEHVHTEEFAGPPRPADPATVTGRVRFTRSGKETDNDGRPLLEQAEALGLRPQHGCRMGICHSCTAVKRTGTVRDGRTGECDGEENAEIQICVSVPVGDVDIDC